MAINQAGGLYEKLFGNGDDRFSIVGDIALIGDSINSINKFGYLINIMNNKVKQCWDNVFRW
jgi:hypothetical protein